MKPMRTNEQLKRLILAEVQSLYKELDTRPIERSCEMRTRCCRFQLTGEIPFVTRGEALVAARAWRATGRKTLPEEQPADGSCPMLEPGTGHCRIYQNRPFPCRTHFCLAAGGPYRRADVIDLIRRLEEIDRILGGDGIARPLRPAMDAALTELRSKK
jgi:Fe-S-cluster containining protein